ncbi:MAG: CtsR family transcriptional regulator [Lactobacillales bacterium]|nr:CtsR family transcriptional regulator [Lactobacillales bacterium]
MASRNTSDLIEAYLKQMIETAGMVEIRRADMASHFNVVPSQINYVINTRFTIPKGYSVVSKRGGGGYIRIVKVQISDSHQLLSGLMQLIGEELGEKDAESFVHKMYEEEVITKREGHLMLAALLAPNLAGGGEALGGSGKIRANLMRAWIERLGYEDA